MSTPTQAYTATSADRRALRPTFEELCQNTRLLIKLRWVAGFSILFSTAFARLVLGIDLQLFPLLLIGLIVLAYNSGLSFLCNDDNETIRRVQQVSWGQIVLDWLAMVALVHFTGGITSPALIYFVVHAALSGTILLPWQTRSLSLLAIMIVGGLAWLERAGWLAHVTIGELGLEGDLNRQVNKAGITA